MGFTEEREKDVKNLYNAKKGKCVGLGLEQRRENGLDCLIFIVYSLHNCLGWKIMSRS